MMATVDIPATGAEGVLVAMGGRVGGYSLFVRNGRLHYWYNLLGMEQTCVTSNREVPKGSSRIGVHFAYDGGGQGKGGTVRLLIDETVVGEARLHRTVPRIFARETFDIGMDLNSPVGDYDAPFAFTGTLERVDIELK
jgi:arylsulfatase